jgi:hypothetical protein
MPAWVEGLLDAHAKAAVADAFAAAQHVSGTMTRLFAFPLTNPLQGVPIHGSSLGLPLALAGLVAITNEVLASGMVATGGISPWGEVRPVAHETLQCKLALDAREGFRVLLYPESNGHQPSRMHAPDRIAVHSLEQARMWAELFHVDRVEALHRMDAATADAGAFVRNCANLPPSFIEWCHNHDRLREVMEYVRKDRTLLGGLCAAAESCMTRERWDLGQARVLIELLGRDQVGAIAGQSPVVALKWCSLNVAFFNHYGRSEEAHRWGVLGEQYLDRAEVRDAATFCNRYLIAVRHNRYDFRDILPDGFHRVLDKVQQIYELGDAAYELGSLYGTLAQNCGFRGPGAIDQTLTYAEKARKAFVRAEKDRDAQTVHAYEVFSFLDAGRRTEARNALWYYLGLHALGWEGLRGRSTEDRFEWHIIARYLADTSGEYDDPSERADVERLVEEILWAFPRMATAGLHPWQLWAFNVGRLADQVGNPTLAEQAWETSRRICSEIAGETVLAMKLLPLSRLPSRGDVVSQAEQLLENIRGSSSLSQVHFQALLDCPTAQEALQIVRDQPHRFFPFSYR